MKPREIDELIQNVLHGSASHTDASRLQELLRCDPAVRRAYWQYAALEQGLAYRFARHPIGMSRHNRGLLRQRRRAMISSLITAAAAMIIVGLVLRAILTPTPPPPAGFTTAPQSIFWVVHTTDDTPPDNTLVEGSSLVLVQGTVELSLAGGTRGVIQAPAKITLENTKLLRMDQGIGWFQVSKEDFGFTIRTPELTSTDLGTEFGVISTPSAHDEIHVFAGRVQAKARGPRGETVILSSGEACRCDPIGRLTQIDPLPTAFLDSLPAELPHVAFDFDRINGDLFEVGGNHPLTDRITARLTGSMHTPHLVDGVLGKALALNGNGEQVVTDWPGIADSLPRTVSVWIRVDPAVDISDSPAIVGWGDPESSNGKWKVLLAQDAAETPAVPRISLGGHAYDAPITANDGHWHHLAVTFSGGMSENNHPEIEIFFDGQRQPLSYRKFPLLDGPRKPETRTQFDSVPVTIGGPIDRESGTFEGEIDELRVHFGVLPDEAIKRAASQGR